MSALPHQCSALSKIHHPPLNNPSPLPIMPHRHVIILTLAAIILASASALAQAPAALGKLFDSSFRDNPAATETVITGSPLKPYSLNIFHSLETSSPTQIQELERAVRSDGASALWKETVARGGHLETGVYELPKGKKGRRYILFLNSGGKATAIFLQGKATPEQIKKLITTMSAD